METLWQDIRYAFRVLGRRPGVIAAAVASLALAIGATTTAFSLIDSVLLKPLPVKDSERLVAVYTSGSSGSVDSNTSYPDYLDFRDQKNVFTDLAAYTSSYVSLNAESGTDRVLAATVTPNYFSVLGLQPVLGRLDLGGEQGRGAEPVAVLGHRFWQRNFASDPGVVGKTVKLNSRVFTIIGVAPATFKGTSLTTSPDVWIPLEAALQLTHGMDTLQDRGERSLWVIGRLADGVALPQASAQMANLARQLEKTYPKTNLERKVTLVPADEAKIEPSSRRSVMRFMSMLMALIVLLLFIACANVANLLLVRGRGRRAEVAIRLAVGGGRRRVMQQFLTESVLLAVIGGSLGLLLTVWATHLLRLVETPADLPITFDVDVDVRTFAFTALLALGVGLLLGLVPALKSTRVDLSTELRERSAVAFKSRFQTFLVLFQVAVSLVLLATAGLIIRSLLQVRAIDPGFRMGNVLIAALDLKLGGYNDETGLQFYDNLLSRARALPGVVSATLVKSVPTSPAGMRGPVFVPGIPQEQAEEMDVNVVTPDYFKTLGIAIRGRDFSPQDRLGAPAVAIINETLARRYWPGQDPVGKQFILWGPEEPPVAIIGVARDGKYRGLREEPKPYVYVSLAQNYFPNLSLAMRTQGDPRALVPVLRQEVRALNANLPIFNVRTLSEQIGRAMFLERLSAILASSLGLLGLILATIGVYGIMNYFVVQRRREIGVRMAMGAQPKSIFGLVIGRALALTLVGIVLGLPVALFLTRQMAEFLYQVSTRDPLTFVGISLLLLWVSLTASFLPTRTATRINPSIALRYE
jgi:putative ABC transport system permease protein